MHEKTIQHIIKSMNEYKTETKCKGVVLGISGGKDSTVVAMLAKKVFGDSVKGLLMPTSNKKDLELSKEICVALNLSYRVIDITDIVEDIKETTEKMVTPMSMDFSRNIAPRIRMTYLYAVAQAMGYRVIGTSNMSEAWIGWTTKFGDNACDFNPIGVFTCSEVVEIGLELAKEFGLDEKYILKTPEDGLSGTSDEENFGFTYAELDKYIETGEETENSEKIDLLHKRSQHKREMPKILT